MSYVGEFKEWNECTGALSTEKSWYYELLSMFEQADATEQRHPRLISDLTRDAIPPAEAEEMRGQIAKLIAEVGTLKSRVRELEGST